MNSCYNSFVIIPSELFDPPCEDELNVSYGVDATIQIIIILDGSFNKKIILITMIVLSVSFNVSHSLSTKSAKLS